MTPWELQRASEHREQAAIFAWANCAALYGIEAAAVPEGYSFQTRQPLVGSPVSELRLLFAIHNQGHGDAIRGAAAKAEGVKAGVPDMMLPVPRLGYAGFFIELKRRKIAGKQKVGVVSDLQVEWIDELRRQGYACSVEVGWIAATNSISRYLGYPQLLKDRW